MTSRRNSVEVEKVGGKGERRMRDPSRGRGACIREMLKTITSDMRFSAISISY